MCELVVLVATWIFEISYSAYVGLLVLHLLLLLIETLAHCQNVVRLSLSHRYSLVYVHLNWLSWFRFRFAYCFSNSMHNFCVIPRSFKDVYVNSIFSHTVSLWNCLSAKCFPLIYCLNGFMSIVNRHIFGLF